MTNITNAWMEKFEIKQPDYDYIERDYIGMKDASFPPARYVKEDNVWIKKNYKPKLFGKKKACLMFVGDITCFDKQIEEASCGKDYDFSYEFEKIKPIFAKADLVVGNLETMIFPEAPYRSERFVSEQNFHCNAPIEFLDAIRKAGIDVLTNANNHDLDTGAVGIGETIDYIERFGLIQTGTFKEEKKRYELIEVNGFKIAIVAFSTNFNNKKCNLTPEGAKFLLNEYSKKEAEKLILQAREDGAELVFTCIHWGQENVTSQNTKQEEIAEELVSLGYDAIIGSHPHVLQPFTVKINGDKIVPIFYSMGNFISHNANNLKARSIVACLELERIGKNILINYSYIPIYTSKDFGDKKYVVLPINKKPIDPRNIKKKVQIAEILGEEIENNKNIHFSECIEKLTIPQKKNEIMQPDLSNANTIPVEHDNGKFVYTIGKEVTLNALSKEFEQASFTIPAKLLGRPVTKVKEGAFENNIFVKKINFTRNLKVVSEKMCKNCKDLEGFQLGSNIVEIATEAFAGCDKLISATMSKNVKKIGSKAFKNCISLKSVKIPSGVTEIAEDAFEGCQVLTFYCESDTYAEKYAQSHKFNVINMKLE